MGYTERWTLVGYRARGGKDLLGKNQEAAFISWTRQALELRNVDCGMRIKKKA